MVQHRAMGAAVSADEKNEEFEISWFLLSRVMQLLLLQKKQT